MARRGGYFSTDRIVALTDGVIAIVITLLVLELSIPVVSELSESEGLWPEIRHLWREYLAYILSFLIVGILWLYHHTVYRRIRTADGTLISLNIFFWMVYREDLINCGAFNPNRYPEDYDLAFRFYKHGLKCVPCDTVLHDWRDYNTRTSRTHIHYAENHFIDLKLHYFLELDFTREKNLVVWGAGKKGKKIAKTLIEKNITFEWICDNPKKIGRDIYGKILQPFNFLEQLKNPQSIITVANKTAQNDIKDYLIKLNLQPIKDYVFFC